MPTPNHGPDCRSRTFPTRCRSCSQSVYVFQCSCNSTVLFDGLGNGWPEHSCHSVPYNRHLSQFFDQSIFRAPKNRRPRPHQRHQPSLREKEYVEAARCLGIGRNRIILRHLLPNALTPILVSISFGVPAAIFGEAGLSFLGIGINDPIPSWGKMVGVSNAYVRVYWHLALFPTVAVALSMLGFSFVGDGLRDALDPKMME